MKLKIDNEELVSYKYDEEIVIPNNVTSIGECAFRDCKSLTNIIISNSVTSIGVGAFYGCESLTIITIPDSVTMIGGFAFYKCPNLKYISIPNSVTSIGGFTFGLCKNLVVRCKKGSYAENYCITNAIEYEIIDDEKND